MRQTSKLLFTLTDGSGSLHRRLYRRMRSLILDGSWPAGTRLPSSRSLAQELGLSRNTALHAIELLIADGWATARRGSAVFVSSAVPEPLPHLGNLRSGRGVPPDPVPFEIGRQTAEFFPLQRWNRLQAEIWAETGSTMLYGTETGDWPALPQALAIHVGETRGLAADPEEVVVVASTQAAIDLVSRLVGKPGDQVWVEDPGYPAAKQLFRLNGLNPVSVPIDAEGLRVKDGVRNAPGARIAYVTAACQFPTGHPMSQRRRAELLSWANENDGWIIEDDWEWHAHFSSTAAHPPLRSLPGGERVIYIQTFNRTIFPGLRVAFLIAPKALAAELLDLNQRIGGGPNVPVQATLARFLDEGLFAAHLRVARAAYAERRDALLAVLQDVPAGFSVSTDRAGLHLVLGVPERLDDARIASAFRSADLPCLAISEFALENMRERGLILGFAAYRPEQIRSAGEILVEKLHDLAGQSGK